MLEQRERREQRLKVIARLERERALQVVDRQRHGRRQRRRASQRVERGATHDAVEHTDVARRRRQRVDERRQSRRRQRSHRRAPVLERRRVIDVADGAGVGDQQALQRDRLELGAAVRAEKEQREGGARANAFLQQLQTSLRTCMQKVKTDKQYVDDADNDGITMLRDMPMMAARTPLCARSNNAYSNV